MTDRQYFFRMFRYVKPYAPSYTIGTFLYSSQFFVNSLFSSFFIGGVTAAILDYNFSGVINTIGIAVLMMVGILVLVGIGAYMYVVTTGYALRDMCLDLFSSFMKTSIESEKHSGEGIAALNTDANTAIDILTNALTPFLMNEIGASFSVAAVFIIDWRMGLGAVAVGLLAFLVQSRFATPLAKLGKAELAVNADLVKSLSNIFAGALTIRVYARQDRALFQFDRENGKLKKIAFKQAFIGMWRDLFTTVQGWLTLVLTFALGGWLVAAGEMDFSRIMMVLPFAEAIGRSMSDIGATFAALQPPIVAAKRVFAIIDAAPETSDKNTENIIEWTGNYEIKASKLSFSYKGASEEALKDIDLAIDENEMIAFVGESGSGKSTLLRVIIGMYERDELNMSIGNLPFAVQNIYDWRTHFAYVDQSCKLFDMSIAENIAMGTQGGTDDEEIQKAAKIAFAHDFISALPDGYRAPCGERGTSLSGGQKQRLAIARALLSKAPVLVFDEATSALDAESERNIMETIENLRSDHTILITTHNLNNIATADKIVVMDGGRIVEVGTHTELLKKNGRYAKLLGEQLP